MYDRQVSVEQVLTFGVSGMLYRNGLIMYDHQTESLWSHILGQAIGGEYTGTRLTFIPALHTTWHAWKTEHPETLVVSPGLYGADPYASYYASRREGVVGQGVISGGGPERGDDIHPKEYVIGVRLAGQARAYPFSTLTQQPVINDRLGDIPIAIFFDRAALAGAVYDRRLADDTVLTFAPAIEPGLVQDEQTGTIWNTLTGQAVEGELAGTRLVPVPSTYAFWFGWIDYHTDSTVYGREGKSISSSPIPFSPPHPPYSPESHSSSYES